MSRGITFHSSVRILFLRKHALVFSSDWTIELTATPSRASHWLSTLRNTGSNTLNLRMWRLASRTGWNVYLMGTNHTLRPGFGFTGHTVIFPCQRCVPRDPKWFPYIMPPYWDFAT